ncbi:MAG: hypothetical protein R3296_12675, partial [Oleiphilaceae bacterium]|nr:hypothetical protein [Oleiphilaceae bacterium]
MNIKKGRLWGYFLLALAIYAPTVSHSAETGMDLKLDAPGKVLSREEKRFGRHVMVAGSLTYRQATAERGREGYLPVSEVVAEGRLRREVVDFDPQSSAHAVFHQA